MNRSSRLLFAFILVVSASVAGCSADPVTPRADMFSGELGGCGDFFVYRFNNDRTLAITVSVDESAFDLSSGRADIEFDSSTVGVAIQVLQFQIPAGEYFCDDVDGDPEPIAEWAGLSGTISLERTMATPPREYANATHRVSIKLADVRIKNKKAGATTTLEKIQIDNIWVGWLAG